MIYTVTFNPSLDYIVSMKTFIPGQVNRTERERMLPGGKGIIVSLVLQNLGVENTALGFVAGFTGEEIQKRVRESGCKEEFIRLNEGYSRINVKLKAEVESEINCMGPEIHSSDLNQLYRCLENLKDQDILVLAGSIPSSVPDTIYSDIMKRLHGSGVKIAVDATKDLLVNVLPFHPFLVKPNHHELGEIFQVSLKDQEEVVPYARKLKEMGAENVLVSMAGKGAVLLDESGKSHQSAAPWGTVVNSVGAGDSMVAGFLAGYLKTNDYHQAFHMGIAAGSASAFSEYLATKSEVEAVLKQLQ